MNAKDCGFDHGISFDNDISLSHVLFVDDIFMVTNGTEQSLSSLFEVLLIFCKASGMKINGDKSALYFSNLDETEIITIHNIFAFSVVKIENGMNYLGFQLKCCRYLLKDWDWLIAKVENMIRNWSFWWLSKGGKLILVKAVLEAIPVFWMHFWSPLGILEKIGKMCFKFL